MTTASTFGFFSLEIYLHVCNIISLMIPNVKSSVQVLVLDHTAYIATNRRGKKALF